MSRTRTPFVARRPALSHSEVAVEFREGQLLPGRTPALVSLAAFSIFFFPSTMVIAFIRASGTLPILLALALLLLWGASWVWGLHDAIVVRHPGRLAIVTLLLTTFVSYLALYTNATGGSSVAARAAADRFLLLLLASAGLILVIGETVRTIGDAMKLTRAILAGAFFCCLVAAVQFVLRVNPMEWLQSAMPGFEYNGGDTPFQDRGNFIRVAGSTFHSIELAVVMAMLLPLSIWRLVFDTRGRRWVHALQTGLIVLAIAATVSRSGILALGTGLAIFVPFLPQRPRRAVLMMAPIAVVALFATMPGFVGTILGALGADSSDPSIATRMNNYPRVARLVAMRPWVGLGPGNYEPATALEILDNQYLGTLVTCGAVGLLGLLVYLLYPALTGLHAARRAQAAALRSLAGATAAGLFVGAVCSLTFDSLSFPVFALTLPVLIGLAGATWNIVKREIAMGAQQFDDDAYPTERCDE